jgi:hypothetical protein
MSRESMGHRASRRAYPEGQFAPMKWVNIKDLWYNRRRTNIERPEKRNARSGGSGRSFLSAETWSLGKGPICSTLIVGNAVQQSLVG